MVLKDNSAGGVQVEEWWGGLTALGKWSAPWLGARFNRCAHSLHLALSPHHIWLKLFLELNRKKQNRRDDTHRAAFQLIVFSYLIDFIHYILVLFNIQIVDLTRVVMKVVQQWRIVVVKRVVITTDWIRVDIGANAPATRTMSCVTFESYIASQWSLNFALPTLVNGSEPCTGWVVWQLFQDLLSHQMSNKCSSSDCSI